MERGGKSEGGRGERGTLQAELFLFLPDDDITVDRMYVGEIDIRQWQRERRRERGRERGRERDAEGWQPSSSSSSSFSFSSAASSSSCFSYA